MGDLGLPGSVVRDARRRAAEEPVGSAQGRPQHHDEPEGRRQAGQLHRGLRRAARASGRIHRRADRGVRAARHARHLVCARLGRHAARAADPRHARAAAARARCARSPRKRRRWCASTRARSAASTATACAAANGSRWQFGPAHQRGVPRDQAASSTRSACSIPARSSTRRGWTTARCSASRRRRRRAPYRTHPAEAGARLVGLGRAERSGHRGDRRAPGTGGDTTGGFAKAVEMCNNNGHCRKFDAGTMCPSYRVTRDEQHLTRGRANTLRLALSGQLGPDAFTSDAMHDTMDLCVGCKGCKRECPTGVDMAKMKIEFLAHYKARHGFTLKDRLIAHLPDYARRREPRRRGCQPAQPRAGAGRARRAAARAVGEALAADVAPRHLLARRRARRCSRRATRRSPPRRPAAAPRCCSSIRSTASSRARTRTPRRACCKRRRLHAAHGREGRRPPLLRPHLSRGGHGRRGEGEGRRAGRRAAAVRGGRHRDRRPRAVVPAHAARRGAGDGPRRQGRDGRASRRCCSRSSSRAKRRRAASRSTLKPADAPILLHGHCHQKAFGAVTPILEVLRLIPGAKPELIESSCCGMAGSFGYEAAHHDVSMQMAEASLLPAVRASARRHRRRRRHQLPPPDRRRRAARGGACGGAARAATRVTASRDGRRAS